MSANTEFTRWALLWWEGDKSKDAATWLIRQAPSLTPVLFRTRREAREYARERYGYILTRKDLRSSPHFWRLPRPVRVRVGVEIRVEENSR